MDLFGAGTANITGSMTNVRIPAGRGASGSVEKGYLSPAQIAALAGGGSGGSFAGFSTPDADGFTTTKDGTGDNTTSLNNWFGYLATNKKAGFLPAGTYRTTAELLLPENAMYLIGAGRNLTRIVPAAKTYHGFRALGSFDLNTHGRYIGNFGVMSSDTSAPAINGKFAFVLDRSPHALVEGIIADQHDIGMGSINNSYNAMWRDCFTNRNNTNCNCGFYIGPADDSGSDWTIYNLHVAGRKTAICIAGPGGGYRVFGFSAGTIGVGSADPYGIITYGYDYMRQVNAEGVGNTLWYGGHLEGWRNAYAFRTQGECSAVVMGCGFNPSAWESGQQARGLIKMVDPRGAIWTWISNNVGNGQFSQSTVCNISGSVSGSFMFNEFGWTSSGMNYVGSNTGGAFQFGNWLRSLLWSSNLSAQDRRGFATWGNHDLFQPQMMLGKGWIVPNPGQSRFDVSWNDGSTWAAL